MKRYLTAAELAGLPGMPGTPRSVNRAGDRGEIERRKKAKGKGWEYSLTSLPAETQRYLTRTAAAEIAKAAPPQPPAPIELPLMADLTDWQREQMHARLAVLSVIDELAQRLGQGKAIAHFIDLVDRGELPETTLATLLTAKNRSHGQHLINRGTLYTWLKLRQQGATALAPKPRRPRGGHKPWLPQLLTLYQQPQKPTIAACVRDWHKHYPDIKGPANLKAAERALKALPAEVREYGRMGKNARRSIQPFVRRTFDGLWPMDVVTVDGHLFKAYVRHPMTGRPFRPELTTYLDIATRKAIGFSAWLAESQFAIWCALREMALDPACGVPAMHYSDNGAYRGEQHRATLERLGTTLMFSEAYRAQARGVIERFNSSVWGPLAKRLPVYAGRDMDKEAFKKAMAIANTDGSNLPGWQEFIGLCRQALAEYNDRPHRSLKGKSPNQAWAEAVADGWRPTTLEQDDLHDLLPSVERRAVRGEVSLPWGRYFSDDLALYHGRTVRVAYEPTNGEQVWISDERGVLLCTAKRDANAKPYINFIEHARAQREQGRVDRLEKKLEAVREEGAVQIDYQPPAVDPILQNEVARIIEAEEQAAPFAALEDDPRYRHAEWLRVRARIEQGEAIDSDLRQQCNTYWNSQSAASQQAIFEEFELTEADFPAPVSKTGPQSAAQ